MKAREAALKALSLDENLAEAHTALGRVLLFYDYDFAGADESIDGQSNSIPTTRPPNPRPLNQSQYAVAVAQAQLGEKEKAITALNRSYENREIAFALANVDPRFDAFRDEVRFKISCDELDTRLEWRTSLTAWIIEAMSLTQMRDARVQISAPAHGCID